MSKLWSSDRELPAPNLEQLRKQAKELVAAVAGRDADAIAFVRRHHPGWRSETSSSERSEERFQLSDAQWAIARYLGDASWPALVQRLARVDHIPLVAIRNLVVFPGQTLTLDVGRPRSITAVNAARAGDGRLVMFAQRVATTETPTRSDLHAIGTVGQIVSVRDAGAGHKVEVAGTGRVKLVDLVERDGMLTAEVAPADAATPVDAEQVRRSVVTVLDELARRLREPSEHPLVKLMTHVNLLPASIQQQILESDDPGALARAIAQALQS
jgi:Lon protease-like protein